MEREESGVSFLTIPLTLYAKQLLRNNKEKVRIPVPRWFMLEFLIIISKNERWEQRPPCREDGLSTSVPRY